MIKYFFLCIFIAMSVVNVKGQNISPNSFYVINFNGIEYRFEGVFASVAANQLAKAKKTCFLHVEHVADKSVRVYTMKWIKGYCIVVGDAYFIYRDGSVRQIDFYPEPKKEFFLGGKKRGFLLGCNPEHALLAIYE